MTNEVTTTRQVNYPTRRHEIRKWILRITLALVIITPLFFVIAAWGSRFGLWSWTFGFGTLTRNVGPKLMWLTLVVGVIAFLASVLIKPKKGILIAMLAIAIPVAGMLYGKSVQRKVQSLPFIHDITTDTQAPPTFSDAIMSQRADVEGVNPVEYVGKKAPTAFGPEGPTETKLVSVLQVKAYPDVRSLVMEEEPDAAFDQALATAKSMGWKIMSEDQAAGTIEATATTFWFGFKDDVAIRVKPAEGGGSIVDLRSVSRVGLSDMGANAARIRDFSARMKAS